MSRLAWAPLEAQTSEPPSSELDPSEAPPSGEETDLHDDDMVAVGAVLHRQRSARPTPFPPSVEASQNVLTGALGHIRLVEVDLRVRWLLGGQGRVFSTALRSPQLPECLESGGVVGHVSELLR